MRDVPFSTRALEMSILACCRAANSSALRPAAFIPRLTSTQKQSLLPPVTEGSVSIGTPRGVAAIRPQRSAMGGPGDECSPEFINTSSGSVVPKSPGEVCGTLFPTRAQTVDSMLEAVDQARLENDSGELHRVVPKHLFTQSIQRLPAECLLM